MNAPRLCVSALFTVLTPLASSLHANEPPSASIDIPAVSARLATFVDQLVSRDEIVGAELLILHRGETVVHQAFGWKDRESKNLMTLDTPFAIRSMTKPFTGMAAQLLIADGTIELDAPVARYLPAFENGNSREITIRHLLTHRSGLPLEFSRRSKRLLDYSGLRELADENGTAGPDYPPGSRFIYSDAGSDALGAVIETVTRQPLHEFVHARILEPLQLSQTYAEFQYTPRSESLRPASRYVGLPGSWSRYWQPGDPSVTPFLKGSGGLISTPRDYARFLAWWMDSLNGSSRLALLNSENVQISLESVSRSVINSGFRGGAADYGQMWTVWRGGKPAGKLRAFGHTGSDGTMAYALPEQDVIVCLFTQTRGGAGIRLVEAAISHAFLTRDPKALNALLSPPPKADHGDLLGLYSPENDVRALGAMVDLDGRLALELPSRQVMILRPSDEPDRWVPDRAPQDAIRFRRSDGRVVGFILSRNGRDMELKRFTPDATLPTADDVMLLRRQAYPLDVIQAMLPLELEYEGVSFGRKMKARVLMQTMEESLQEMDIEGIGVMRTWVVGRRAWNQSPGKSERVELHGRARDEEIAASLPALLGDWRDTFTQIAVVGRERSPEGDLLLVRVSGDIGFGWLRRLNERTGALVGEKAISTATGAGPLPMDTRYGDFRPIQGLSLPHEHIITFPKNMGSVQLQLKKVTPRATAAASEPR